jgi:hypothetical protein
VPWAIPGSFIRSAAFALIIAANVLFVLLKTGKFELPCCEACFARFAGRKRASRLSDDGGQQLALTSIEESPGASPGASLGKAGPRATDLVNSGVASCAS